MWLLLVFFIMADLVFFKGLCLKMLYALCIVSVFMIIGLFMFLMALLEWVFVSVLHLF